MSEFTSDQRLEMYYAEGTIGSHSTNGWYYHRLNPETETALAVIKSWMQLVEIDIFSLVTYTLHVDLTLLRYLRGNNFNIEKTKEHILKNIQWRKDINIHEIIAKPPSENLQTTLRDFLKYQPHWSSGYDVTGR